MKIGIDGSRAFLKERTGIEEYSYQLISHLRRHLDSHRVILYLRKDQVVDFELPKNWQVKKINLSRFWTQIGLSLETFNEKTDILLVPAHTLPVFHPRRSVVVIHGLEYEIIPKAYSMLERLYMRISIKLSCRWAKKIIAVSQNTKNDLIELYNVPAEKIKVIYEGVNQFKSQSEKFQAPVQNFRYLLFVGRLEMRKNVEGVIEAFEILKEEYKIPHKLILAGRPGYGYESIKRRAESAKHKDDIIFKGFVKEREKWELMKGADVFLFPTFYEGFGLPILEAQSLGVPVVASDISSIPEVAGEGAALASPDEPKMIAYKALEIIRDEKYRSEMIEKGRKNAKKFSWEKCAWEVTNLLNGQFL
jgi:glycosyltransferase involved in cell wall biosynthesis